MTPWEVYYVAQVLVLLAALTCALSWVLYLLWAIHRARSPY